MPAAPATETRKAKFADRPFVCGFCSAGSPSDPQTGKHVNCPRAIRNGAAAEIGIFTCECPVVGCGDQVPRCLDCKTELPDAVNIATWSCFDKTDCNVRRQHRLDVNPTYQKIAEIREFSMARIANEKAATGTDKPARVAKDPVLKVGTCLHCGEATKGGKFLPGHDAAYVSQMVKASMAKPATADANRKKVLAGSDTLAAKFDKSLGLAQAKVVKDAKAKVEKEAAAAAAKAAKAATPKGKPAVATAAA